MARTALKEPQLKSWEAVNQTLADIAEARREIELEQAACNEQVDHLKTESKVAQYEHTIIVTKEGPIVITL